LFNDEEGLEAMFFMNDGNKKEKTQTINIRQNLF